MNVVRIHSAKQGMDCLMTDEVWDGVYSIDSEDSVDMSVLLTRGCIEAAHCRVPTRAQ